jgi:galactoside O-acetyltransferase
MTSFYTDKELLQLGLGKVGNNVKLSKKASIYNPENIILGDNVRIDDFCILSAGGGKITLGNHIHIACFCALYAQEQIVMEDFSGLSSRVVIYTYSDDYSGRSLTNPTIPEYFCLHPIKGAVILKKHVIIGTNSTILPNVTIGIGSAIGAHSLVTKNLAEWGIYFGIPVKKIKERKQDLLELEKQFLETISHVG